ncbi:MAG: CoA transferase, partial [Acidimicrobiales bacterium]|nr:CoA transferase [Acidimicrobiales bacterium]
MEGRRHPLTGLRVLEMGSRVAAPYVGKLFADAGADVCKVESPAGDQFRRWSASGATIPAGEDAAWFRFLNGGKRSVVVDLGAEGGRDELLVLVAGVDLVLDDHDPADARALGITADDLRAVNPAVVVATLTPFGTTGPWADRPANDFVLQALVGSTEVRGMPGEEPVSVGGDLGDFTAAAFAAPAALAATLAARASGRGVHVDCSQYEAMMHSFQVFRPMYESMAPDYEFPRQFMIPSIEPASDGMVAMCCVTGQQWQDFCAMIGAPEFGDDPMFLRFIGRLERKEEVWERIHAFTRAHTVDEIIDLASAFRIPCGPVGDGLTLPGYDHFVERGVFVDHPQGFIGPRPSIGFSEST